MAQYLQFQHPHSMDGAPLHVYHNHSPSSENGVLTPERKSLIFSTLWRHVLEKDPRSAAQPATVFGGDFNCTPLQWDQMFDGRDEHASLQEDCPGMYRQSYLPPRRSNTCDQRSCFSGGFRPWQKPYSKKRAIAFLGCT